MSNFPQYPTGYANYNQHQYTQPPAPPPYANYNQYQYTQPPAPPIYANYNQHQYTQPPAPPPYANYNQYQYAQPPAPPPYANYNQYQYAQPPAPPPYANYNQYQHAQPPAPPPYANYNQRPPPPYANYNQHQQAQPPAPPHPSPDDVDEHIHDLSSSNGDSISDSDDEDDDELHVASLKFTSGMLAPKPLSVARSDPAYLPRKGMTLDSKDDAILRSSAYSECFGRKNFTKRSSKDYLCYTCASPSCSHAINWKCNATTGKWQATEVKPHNCSHWPLSNQGKGSSSRAETTNFTCNELAPLLLSAVDLEIQKGNPGFDTSFAQAILLPYTYQSSYNLPVSFIRRIVARAKKLMLGSLDDQAKLMGPLKTVLEEDGHHLDIETCGLAQQKRILRELAKKAHEYEHQGEDPIPPFEDIEDSLGLYDCVKHCDASTEFLYAYHFVPRYAKDLIDQLKSVRACDAYHMKTALGGTAVATWGVTANDNLVLLCLSWFADNESTSTWTKHLKAMLRHCPNVDQIDHIHIADGDKGYASAHKSLLKHTNRFFCCHHKKDHVATRGKEQKELYLKAVKAKTLAELSAIKAQYRESTQAYLEKYPDEQLYLAAVNGSTYGRTASQLAESGGACINNYRRSYPVAGLILFISDEFDRLKKYARIANNRSNVLTPSASKHLASLKAKQAAKTAMYGVPVVRPARRSRKWATVSSTRNPRIQYCITDESGCDCGEKQTRCRPCVHELEAAERLANKAPCDLYNDHDRTSAWKAQCEVLGTLRPVNLVRLHSLAKSSYVLPVAKKQPRGRPKRNNRVKSKAEVARKKANSKHARGKRKLSNNALPKNNKKRKMD